MYAYSQFNRMLKAEIVGCFLQALGSSWTFRFGLTIVRIFCSCPHICHVFMVKMVCIESLRTVSLCFCCFFIRKFPNDLVLHKSSRHCYVRCLNWIVGSCFFFVCCFLPSRWLSPATAKYQQVSSSTAYLYELYSMTDWPLNNIDCIFIIYYLSGCAINSCTWVSGCLSVVYHVLVALHLGEQST